MKVKELRDIIVSAVVLALAFGIALSGGISAFENLDSLALVIGMSFVAVSLGFVFHEMGHRAIAKRFGYFAEYAMWPFGLVMALGSSFLGFIFAAPGAVMIRPHTTTFEMGSIDKEKIGIISLAGPGTSIGLALIFLLLDSLQPTLLYSLGARINIWLAVFNLIPFSPLDGAKILAWNKFIWLVSMAFAVGLYFA